MLSIVIPAKNEELRIGNTIDKIVQYCSNNEMQFEIIIVIDHSDDKTAETAKAMYSDVKILVNTEKKGKGTSVKLGMLHAIGDYILFSDADLSTPIEELDKFFQYFNESYDIVIGSRKLKDSKVKIPQPLFRKISGDIFASLRSAIFLPDIKDTQCGFKCFTKKAAKNIFSKQKIAGFSFDVEILYIAEKLGYKIKELPVVWINDARSKIKPLNDSFKMLAELIQIKINSIMGKY